MSGKSRKAIKKDVKCIPVVKKVNLKPTATAYLQVFGTGSGGTNPSVFLFSDTQRYVFSCGEATQKLFNENKLKLGKINNLFLTQLSWDFIGGLPGLLLTLRDTGKTKPLNIHGPDNFSQIFTATKPFLSLQYIDTNCIHYTGESNEKYEDENIKVWPIFVRGKECENFSYNSKIIEIQDNKDLILTENPNKTGKQKHFDSEGETNIRKKWKADVHPWGVVSYVCQLVPVPGKMNIAKAIELGVPNGPMLGRLQKGETITLENGKVVKPEEIMEPSFGSTVFCIIDCPNKHYFDKLITNTCLKSYEVDGGKTQPAIMVHLSPAAMAETPEYISWTKRFGRSCQHLFLNSDMCAPKVALLSQFKIQYKLHQINSDLFPRLYASEKPKTEINQDLNQNWKAGESFLIYHLRPAQKMGYDYSEISSKWEKIIKAAETNLDLTKTSHDGINDFKDPTKFVCSRNTDMISEHCVFDNEVKCKDAGFEIVFLGTGAALPSKYRNVSSTLVNISKAKVMLLDCGEGTYGQLYRHYGPELEKILLRLCCVFISHIHADHHLGLIKVLQARQTCIENLPDNKRPDSVLIVGPPSLLYWLKNYATFYGTLHLRFLDSVDCQKENFIGNTILSSTLESEKAVVVPVIHCANSFGLVLSHKNDWKLVYSGDTRPCPELIKEGKGTTILVHEATFEDDLSDEAIAKLHCTTTEAIECGQEMKAEYIILNHFSQRYPKIPVFNKKFNSCTGIAFDHMTVNFKSIQNLSKLLDPLQELFKDEDEEKDENVD